jgi:hypothetical protein
MGNGEDPKESKKGGFPIATVSLWAAAVIIFYALGSGPVMMLSEKGALSRKTDDVLGIIYAPMIWAYADTPLHKPIGMYRHLWCKGFDSSGEFHL